jgi:hypothetical protein
LNKVGADKLIPFALIVGMIPAPPSMEEWALEQHICEVTWIVSGYGVVKVNEE